MKLVKESVKRLLGDRRVLRISHWQERFNRAIREREDAKRRYRFYSTFIRSGDLCFDVGANNGNRISPLLRAGARVVAVEPQESCIRALEVKFGRKIIVVEKGLDEKEGTRDFHLSDADTISSFSEEWIDAVKKTRFSAHTWNTVVSVPMTTLDRLVKEYGVPAFIKIDVEGFETSVLKGLTHAVPMISFEYTVPEQTGKAEECIALIERNSGDIECNYSVGESMEFAGPWLSAADMRRLVHADSFTRTGVGDIYVRSRGTAA